MLIKKMKEIEPLESNCISVDSPEKLFTIGESGNLITHNSVSQQNIIISCLLRPENWVILGIDLKRVELSRYKKFGVKVATELEAGVEFLRFAQAVMMKRYTRMEELGINDFEDLPEKTQALLVMIDEAGELLSPSGAKALSENTIIPLANGRKKIMRELKVGDVVLDNNYTPTTVERKYEPEKQEHYSLSISKDSEGKSERFTSGAEHLWVVYIKEVDGKIIGPEIMNTKQLFDLKKAEDKKNPEKRREIKFKATKAKNTF